MAFCIPREHIGKLKESVAALSEKNQIEKLVEMTSSERIDFFKKTLDEKTSVSLNKSFERAVSGKQMRSLGDWVNSNLNEKYRKDEIQSITGKVFKNLEESNAFIETKARGLADKKAGVALTEKEIRKFTELGQKMYEEGARLGRNFIDLTSKEGYEKSLAFGKAHKEIEEFTRSLLPVSPWRSFVNRIGRATMLTSIKSPFLNIESNTLGGITEAIGRRIAGGQYTNSLPKGVQMEYVRNVNKFFKETGIDMSRMISFEDTVTGVGKITGEKVTEGKFLKRYTDFVFNKLLTTPDVAFSSFAFSDSAALLASKIAKKDSKKAAMLFKDATLLNPLTEEGQIIRAQAVADARMATYTNESFSSRFLESTRELFNRVGGLGDIMMPFVKTPANVAELGAKYAGLGFITGGTKGGKVLYTTLVKKGEVDRVAMRGAINDIVRAGLGMTLGAVIAAQLDADDFMGAYDPARVKIDQLSNTSYNAIKIQTPSGERWISVDYFGAIGATIVGYMYAKKYGEDRVKGYVSGATSQYLSAMGIGEVFSSVTDTLSKIDPNNIKQMTKTFGDDLARSFGDVVTSRIVPGIVYDLARATDEVQRDTRQKKFIVTTPLFDINLDQLVNKIPFFREDLPVKFDALGRVMYEESAIDSLLFGARVRTARMDAIVSEIYRLRDKGQLPAVKDLRFSYSSKVDELKKKTGDEFYAVAREYGETLAKKFEQAIKSPSYKNLSDEEKKKRLDAIVQQEYERILLKNGVKYR